MAAKYNYVKEFKGYVSKPDVTNTDERYLTKGSLNVLVNDGEKVTGRRGYSLFGAASTVRKPIQSTFTWNTSSATELTLRGTDNSLQVYFNNAWRDVITGLPTAQFGFPRSSKSGIWDDSEGIDILPFVAKDANIYTWNGAIGTIDSTTSNTIVLTGDTIAVQRFFTTSGTLIVNGTEYAYTGTSGNTFTGVTPNPTGEANGSVVSQKVTTNSNKPGSGLTNDICEILNNQLYVGDFSSREVYISTNTDLTDFTTISTPREPGESLILTLDNAPVAFVVQEENMYISAGTSDWYQVVTTLQNSGSTFIENIAIKKLKNAPQQAVKEKDLTANIKNAVVYISNEPTLDSLGRVENITTPQSTPLSDPIKPDFDSYNFTGGDIIYYKNQVFISVPEESLVLIYDLANSWWQPPQQLPVAKFSVYQGKLLGHSKEVQETYEMFPSNMFSDNGNIINMQAVFAYRDFGDRALLKEFDEYYTEGYIKPSTNLTLTLQFDFEGASSEVEYTIHGNDKTITFGKGTETGLGSLPLGSATLGSSSEEPRELKKFRHVQGTTKVPFWEMRAIYSTTADNAEFEIIAHGPQVRFSPNQNNSITK